MGVPTEIYDYEQVIENFVREGLSQSDFFETTNTNDVNFVIEFDL